MSTIDDLENNVSRLTDELRTAKEKLTAAKIEASPAKIGMIYVRTTTRGWGSKAKTITQRGQVVRYGNRYHPEVPVLRLFKADGSLGVVESYIDRFATWKPE